jgi:hypothetical protein
LFIFSDYRKNKYRLQTPDLRLQTEKRTTENTENSRLQISDSRLKTQKRTAENAENGRLQTLDLRLQTADQKPKTESIEIE